LLEMVMEAMTSGDYKPLLLLGAKHFPLWAVQEWGPVWLEDAPSGLPTKADGASPILDVNAANVEQEELTTSLDVGAASASDDAAHEGDGLAHMRAVIARRLATAAAMATVPAQNVSFAIRQAALNTYALRGQFDDAMLQLHGMLEANLLPKPYN